jgi:hypothetical protein
VSVSVPIDEQNPYQVLLLAGYNQTLLAAGYRPITGTPKDDVYIKADQANIVSITVETFPLQWDTSASNAIVADSGTPTKSTNDFEFSAVITGYGTVAGAKHYEVKSRYINFAPVDTVTDPALKGGTAITPASDKFEVRFHVPKLDPLIKMDINTDATVSMLTIAGYNVGLVPRYTTDYFKPVTFVADATKVSEESTGDTDPDGTSAARYKITIPTTAPLSITFGNNPSDAINGGLPAKDVDGLLRFELTYYAFGTRASKGMGWTIRNGLDRTADDDDTTGTTGNGGIGGYFPVKIGKGSDPQPQDVIIFY